MIVYVLFGMKEGLFVDVLNVSYTAFDSQRAALHLSYDGLVYQVILVLQGELT